MTVPNLEALQDLEGGTVLVRLDLNVPLDDGKVLDDSRVRAALPTVKYLLRHGARVALCSHLGKAAGVVDPTWSLRPVAPVLAHRLDREVPFVDDCLSEGRFAALDESDVVLLENLRFYPGEKANDKDFAAQLADGFTHYVNDAFGTAHRKHASVSAVASCFDPGRKASGLLMALEIEALGRVIYHPEQPFAAVVGGAKISSKTATLEALLRKVERLLIGGGMANTFLRAQGLEVGRSLFEEEMVVTATTVIQRAREKDIELLLPSDVVVTDTIDGSGRIDVVAADSVGTEDIIVDLGPQSRARYREALADAKTVFWNGPMGVFEVDAFAAGTLAIAEAMADSSGFTVVGGGESALAIKKAGVEDCMSHVSTGGGASLKFITGDPMPALVALEV